MDEHANYEFVRLKYYVSTLPLHVRYIGTTSIKVFSSKILFLQP